MMPSPASFLHPFRRQPATQVAAILTLGLGLGAMTAGYAFVDAMLLRPLPYAAPDQLVAVYETAPGQPRRGVAPANFLDWRLDLGPEVDLAAWSTSSRTLDPGDGAERVRVTSVSGNFFTMLGARAALGRTLLPAEDAEAGARRVVLSHATWQRLFNGRPGVIGQTVRLDEVGHQVVGVMGPDFRPPEPATLWVLGDRGVPSLPGFPGDLTTQRDIHYFRVMARLPAGQQPPAFDQRMRELGARLAERYPSSNRDLGAMAIPLREALLGSQRGTLLVLFAAVGLVLLIAAANTANLLLVAADARHREFSIRTALGASRLDLTWQLAREGIVLALGAGALGALLAYSWVSLVGRSNPLGWPTVVPVTMDLRVLMVGLVLALVFGLGAATLPVWRASTPLALGGLRGGRGADRSKGGRLSEALAVSQLALSLTLLTGAGLLVRGYQSLSSVDPGFDPDALVVIDVAASRAAYPTSDQVRGYFDRVLEAATRAPGVTSISAISNLPTSGRSMNRGFRIDGRADPARPADQTIEYQVADPGYFATMAIPIRSGRSLDAGDGAGAPLVAVINEAAASRYWPDTDPIGSRLGFGRPDRTMAWVEVVGVVGDVHQFGLDAAAEPEAYVPMAQDPAREMTLVMRAGHGADPSSLRALVREADPSQAVSAPRTLEAQLAGSLARPRFFSAVLAAFASLALVLAAIGLHGQLSQVVQNRTREIGVRLALGAEPRRVVGMILGRASRLVGLGLVLGIFGALGLGRLLTGMLFGISPGDPVTFGLTAAGLSLVALVAAGLPARRAAKLDPARVLDRADS